ncbi:MAG: Bax inhibitor-1/YccA family protein [Microthrixaceae bacterium]
MANPMLTDRSLKDASSWGRASAGGADAVTQWPPPGLGGPAAPLDGGGTMTMRGTAAATGVLLVLLLISAGFGWVMTGGPEAINTATGVEYSYSIPIAAWVGVGIGVICVFALWFKPRLAKFIAPIYALAEGFFVGAISRMYETAYDGIVVQAVGMTLAVFAVMLFLYAFRIIKVSDKFRRTVIFATLGIMVFYGLSFLVSLFAGRDSLRFLSSPSLLGIGFSVVVAVVAALNLALDFDFIERGERMGLHRDFEWYGAFGLLVTIVWLYLELLRLLSKLRSR